MTAGLLLLPFPALAQYPGGGSYSAPTYSGGTVTIAYPSGPASFNYSLNSQDNTWGGRYYASGYADSSISVTCSDPIGTTFNWQPASGQTVTTDPPPACVILTEYCQTHWYGSTNNGTVTGGCSNPMGGSAVPYSPPPGSFWEATKYSVITNPPPTLSISSSPSATATSAASNSAGTGVASVSYSAAVSPVTVTLSVYQALAGQQITATLNGVSSSWVSSYTWSFSGGTGANPIKNWDPNGTAADGVTPQQLFPLTSADLTGTDTTGNGISVAPVKFYDQAPDNAVVVTCTATLKFPDGTTANVTAISQPVAFMKPTVTYWGIAEGYVQTGSTLDGPSYGLFPDPSTSYGGGMNWHDVAVTVPAPFSGGQCDFGQLVQPDAEEYHGTTSTPLNNDPKNGLLGLDGDWPYSTGGHGSGWTPPATGANRDSPQFVPDRLNSNNDTQISLIDTFTTWVTYMPPPAVGGAPSIWVPLEKYSWAWSEQLTWGGGQWNLTAAFPWTAGAAPTYTHQPTNDPPQWTLVH